MTSRFEYSVFVVLFIAASVGIIACQCNQYVHYVCNERQACSIALKRILVDTVFSSLYSGVYMFHPVCVFVRAYISGVYGSIV